ncbi:uncharacterized protein LOC132278830 [Cornus florida]|uniref:uncharacterized protein LOC132278830 n=1 Tax=Cornus florida TaxID=4283 RepID=UPI00289EC238|nr:uncharacterized protein LOC132278830 [Cornus florida]
MGRESSDQQHTVIHSSIALLQERFRQLERMKEMREERELMRMISESHDQQQYSSSPTMHYEPSSSSFFFHSELILPPRVVPPVQVSLSLWPNSQSKCSDFRGLDQTAMKTWPTDTPLVRASPVKSTQDSDSDVDTSLHL